MCVCVSIHGRPTVVATIHPHPTTFMFTSVECSRSDFVWCPLEVSGSTRLWRTSPSTASVHPPRTWSRPCRWVGWVLWGMWTYTCTCAWMQRERNHLPLLSVTYWCTLQCVHIVHVLPHRCTTRINVIGPTYTNTTTYTLASPLGRIDSETVAAIDYMRVVWSVACCQGLGDSNDLLDRSRVRWIGHLWEFGFESIYFNSTLNCTPCLLSSNSTSTTMTINLKQLAFINYHWKVANRKKLKIF